MCSQWIDLSWLVVGSLTKSRKNTIASSSFFSLWNFLLCIMKALLCVMNIHFHFNPIWQLLSFDYNIHTFALSVHTGPEKSRGLCIELNDLNLHQNTQLLVWFRLSNCYFMKQNCYLQRDDSWYRSSKGIIVTHLDS